MDVQKLLDAISAQARRTRSNYHLTLGGLIETLEAAPPEMLVMFDHGSGVGRSRSYRGYYSDLAIENGAPVTAADLLVSMRGAVGKTFQGYKGGDYVMGEETPLWNSEYGTTGLAIVGARVDGDQLTLITKGID